MASKIGEIRVQIVLQIVEQNGVFEFADLGDIRNLGRIDEHRSHLLHRVQRLRHHGIDGFVEAEVVTGHADARALESVGIAIRHVGPGIHPRVCGGGGIVEIRPGNRVEHHRGVTHGAAHRSHGVLIVRDGNDPRSAHEADGRLDADNPADGRRAQDRAIGFRADGGRAEIGRDRHAGAGTRARRITIEGVRISGLPAARSSRSSMCCSGYWPTRSGLSCRE